MASAHARTGVVTAEAAKRAAPDVDAHVHVDRLHHVFGRGAAARTVLGSVDFTVARGEHVSVVGPSGSGKTTVLRCVAGLLTPTSGQVRLDGAPVAGPPESLAVVFQDYSRSLLPWLTVRSNVALPLRGKGIPAPHRRERAAEALAAVGLKDSLHQYPWQLSGGMQQRVAIARALAYRPEVLLMDEPFASVDAQTRSDLEDLVLRLKRVYAMTVIAVTHDIDEAVYLSDRVVVLSGHPAEVVESVPIDLGADRDQLTTKSDPRFARLRARVLRAVRH
ncbi:NitT/TauT family transport system ATP-binding protein [Prauserella shujinwangii]|uniref:NitT/TauT family transport system ATP-binding protein n=1 Tax=Prauserella shujinwangii TaxID=1453103 RepID=A0A2T0LSM5_9PSEU|nr:NitT/TauT family transport system ATP-binding protein [Prauserella shujinwangii]